MANKSSAADFWQKDSDAVYCKACAQSFTMLKRKHHCRSCGLIFCQKCSSQRAPVPSRGHATPQRVCNPCFQGPEISRPPTAQAQKPSTIAAISELGIASYATEYVVWGATGALAVDEENGERRMVHIGTVSGATTTKTGGVWEDGSPVSLELQQSETNTDQGTAAVVVNWMEGVEAFLVSNDLSWDQVAGVGLAIPGPYLSYGVLGKSANLPAGFEGWQFYAEFLSALEAKAGRKINLVCDNDGNMGGVGEAAAAIGTEKATVLMLTAGVGLGGAYMDVNGLALEGDTYAGMEVGHQPAPLHLLGGIRPFSCGCGRDWGCFEAYTSLSGLPQLLQHFLARHPQHELASCKEPPEVIARSLRERAQKGDELALEIFDFQARALGLHVAALTVALDAKYVVIGGRLVDPSATTARFRARYMGGIRKAAEAHFLPQHRSSVQVVEAKLGKMSQAIGAALNALKIRQGFSASLISVKSEKGVSI